MLSELGRRPMISGNEGLDDDIQNELGLLLLEQRRQGLVDDRELNLYRSGSAPPTVEGSLSAVGGLYNVGAPYSEFGGAKNHNGFSSEEELRSHPDYVDHYYSNVNLNPRLPPPMVSREEMRMAHRLKGGSSLLGGIGDRRKVNKGDNDNHGNRSLFSMPPGFNSRKSENELEMEKVSGTGEWGGDGLIGLTGVGLGGKQKSLAEMFEDDMGRATQGHSSRPASRNAFDDNSDLNIAAEMELAHIHKTIGPPTPYTYASVVGGGASLSRSTTPDPQHIARAPSPCLTPIGEGRITNTEKRGISSPSSFNNNESNDLVSALSGMNLSGNNALEEETPDTQIHQNYMFNNNQMNQRAFLKKSESGHLYNGAGSEMTNSSFRADMPKQGVSMGGGNSYLKGSPTSTLNGGGGGFSAPYPHLDSPNSSFSNYDLNGYSLNPALMSMMASQIGTGNLPPLFENVAAASAMGLPGMDLRGLGSGQNLSEHHLNRAGSQLPYVDPMYLQYLRTSEYAAHLSALNDPAMDRNFMGNSYSNLLDVQKAYLGSLLAQKSQYGMQMGGPKSGSSNHHAYYNSPGYGIGMSYPGNSLLPNSPMGPGSPMRHSELNMRFPSSMRNLAGGGLMGPWDASCNIDSGFGSSLLEEFKSNKAKCFELLEIAGHVVEFSADQYGSRFIQQKLETATIEEKNMVYAEITPHSLALMTDVFGNYVIQKFFEHGLPTQRRELAGKLLGNVLTLSLQMYGCRVIQKAIEVVDLDQKIQMVQELDGHVMRCVRDQNGNHVIQKCIECVPEENIQFIVSTFFDQVVILSTHPYGCRVIQRILEHCMEPKTQSKVMEEILGSVSMLAQDQYGNYVVQHVLEHGKPEERSVIIKELAGKIVQMSQQKFASNVVEKCLAFGGPAERQLLVNEMLGTTDENEPLQAMMKDQFANYVVQKVLETCEDQQRELILSRIKVHLNALKKYTYGKHIVARVEKLVAAGERRVAAQILNKAQFV